MSVPVVQNLSFMDHKTVWKTYSELNHRRSFYDQTNKFQKTFDTKESERERKTKKQQSYIKNKPRNLLQSSGSRQFCVQRFVEIHQIRWCGLYLVTSGTKVVKSSCQKVYVTRQEGTLSMTHEKKSRRESLDEGDCYVSSFQYRKLSYLRLLM